MKQFHNVKSIHIAVLVLLFDQLSKYLIKSVLILNQSLPIIPNIFHLTLIYNTGAGFGMLKGQRIFFIVFSLIVLIALAFKWKKIPQRTGITVPLGLIIGGLLGNLLDRSLLGYVVDFLDFRIWPVFNAADSAISIGVIWLVIYLWKKK